jgi:hypothetical protein
MTILLALCTALQMPVPAQSVITADPPPVLRLGTAIPAPAILADVSWIRGHWRARALGGLCEEVWSEALAGSMMGMFRLIGAGEVQFYELMTITEEAGTLVLRIRHFSDRLQAWEEKEAPGRFALVRMEGDAACFDGITFSREGQDGLLVQVLFDAGGPREEIVPFPYRRHTPESE